MVLTENFYFRKSRPLTICGLKVICVKNMHNLGFLEHLIASFYILDYSSCYTRIGTRMSNNLCKALKHRATEYTLNLCFNNGVSTTLHPLLVYVK